MLYFVHLLLLYNILLLFYSALRFSSCKVLPMTPFNCNSDMVLDGDRSLVAGRSQREKRRSYKDLLREEEEIAAQVRKSSKKRTKVSCFWNWFIHLNFNMSLQCTIGNFNTFGSATKSSSSLLEVMVSFFKTGFRAFYVGRGVTQEKEET